MEKNENDQLIKLACAGDEQSINTLLSGQLKPLIEFLRHYISFPDDKEIASDLADEALMSANLALRGGGISFETPSKFHAWIRKIAKNAFMDHVREEAKQARNRERNAKTGDLRTGASESDELDVEVYVYVEHWSQELYLALRRSLKLAFEESVDRQNRVVLFEHVINGLSHDEISQKFGIPEWKSRKRLSAGYAELRNGFVRVLSRPWVKSCSPSVQRQLAVLATKAENLLLSLKMQEKLGQKGTPQRLSKHEGSTDAHADTLEQY